MAWHEEKIQSARSILKLLYENRMIKTFYRDKRDGWTLVSGLYSPLYIQLRPLISYPQLFTEVCSALAEMTANEAPEVVRVVGIAMAGVPIAAGMCFAGRMPGCFTRKMEGVKSLEDFRRRISEYGEHALVEGEIQDGDNLALVDDLVTRFDSKLIAFEQIRHEIERRKLRNVSCSKAIVLIDREQGASMAARDAGFEILSLIPFRTMGLELLKGILDKDEWTVISDYLGDPTAFQSDSVRRRLAQMSLSSD
ncbi:MAG: orotate phosphoribosyltransferase [Desulfomonilaceae bacterium]